MHIPNICPAPFLSFRMTNFSWSQFVISGFCSKPYAAPLEVPLWMMDKQSACGYGMNQQQKLPGCYSDL